jgi:hypothetical protein
LGAGRNGNEEMKIQNYTMAPSLRAAKCFVFTFSVWGQTKKKLQESRKTESRYLKPKNEI